MSDAKCPLCGGAWKLQADLVPPATDHAKSLAMLAWFASRGASNAGQWPGDPDDFTKQNRARDEFEAWWRGR